MRVLDYKKWGKGEKLSKSGINFPAPVNSTQVTMKAKEEYFIK